MNVLHSVLMYVAPDVHLNVQDAVHHVDQHAELIVLEVVLVHAPVRAKIHVKQRVPAPALPDALVLVLADVHHVVVVVLEIVKALVMVPVMVRLKVHHPAEIAVVVDVDLAVEMHVLFVVDNVPLAVVLVVQFMVRHMHGTYPRLQLLLQTKGVHIHGK